MPCEYCDRGRSTTYTLEATVGDTEATVAFEFCSRACVTAWAAPGLDYASVTASGNPVDGAGEGTSDAAIPEV